MKNPYSIPLVLLGCALTAACDDHSGSVTQPPTATSITISAPSRLRVDSSVLATAQVLDQHGAAMAGQVLTWRSNNEAALIVNREGVLNGVGAGSAEIEAVSGSARGSATITVLSHQVTRVGVTLTAQLRMGNTATATASVLDEGGGSMSGQTVTWRSGNPGVATVNNSGLITAVAAGTAEIQASVGAIVGSATVTVLPHEVTRIAVTVTTQLRVGETTVASARVVDESGSEMSGQPVSWRSSNQSVASIDSAGVIVALSPGTTDIQASLGNVQATATLTVLPILPTYNFAISAAQWTQGVQSADGSMPIILNGGASAVNVLLTSTATAVYAMQVVLRLYDANLQLYRSDTVLVTVSPGSITSFERPTVQFLVPSSAIRPGMSWQVVRDPRGLMPDLDARDDMYPTPTPVILATANVPMLKLRFVPIVLSANGNSTGSVTSGNLTEYLRTLRSVHPVGAMTIGVGAAFITAANFGVAPAGGDASFWMQVLNELDLARVLDPTAADEYWIGVVAPPAGFNNTYYGGFGYIPSSLSAIGTGTRTSVLVNVGWFSQPTQSRDLVAHELGHNFGRMHAPACGAGGPDVNYPFANGIIGRAGHDVYAWSNGLSTGAASVSSLTGDVMGYCFPVWASEYTYRGVFNFRGLAPLTEATKPFARALQKMLVIRGQIAAAGVTLQPVMMVETARRASMPAGDYVVEGTASDGTVLFRHTFEPAQVDHADARPFTLLVPSNDDIERSLVRVTVRGLMGTSEMTNEPGPSVELAATLRPTREDRKGSDWRVGCNGARAVLVQDARTHLLLAMGQTDFVTLSSLGADGAVVWCSTGVTSRRFTISPQDSK